MYCSAWNRAGREQIYRIDDRRLINWLTFNRDDFRFRIVGTEFVCYGKGNNILTGFSVCVFRILNLRIHRTVTVKVP